MKAYSKPVEEHEEVPLADDGRWEAVVEDWKRRAAPERAAKEGGNACFVLCVHRNGDGDPDAQLAELTSLVATQGDHVVGTEIHALTRPDPRMLIRAGVAERVGANARSAGADMLVIDAALTPSQTRNLEDATGLPVCDREAVILNVFERHAATARARAQVQIAHLEYLRPRIRGIGLNMDQQAGGVMGSRGPGETASELFARRLDDRLAELRRRLEQIKRSDAARRSRRSRAFRVVLVGYTNAGKTSLMNAMTHAGLSARDRPFETLDTTTRCLSRHGGDVLLSDTVGFIRRLPEHLFASFESTLAEVSEASLLLVVADASDPEVSAQLQLTKTVLDRLGAGEIPRVVVFNKVDRLQESRNLQALADGSPSWALSAHDPGAVGALCQAVLDASRAKKTVRQLFVSYERGALIGQIYSQCRVLNALGTPNGTQLLVEGESHVVDQFARATRRTR